jgi:DNA-binding beta-propeller fold protein YncE
MRAFTTVLLSVCVAVAVQAIGVGQQPTPVPPPATALPSHPFFILKTWVIGGIGDWDYLTMDPTARELFIAHGPTIQVVDVDSGTVAGTVKGFRQAHEVVLDGPGGAYGYATDGQADVVRVFDRRSFQIVANIPTGPSPRSMALDASSDLLFVIGGQPGAAPTLSLETARAAGSARTAPASHNTLHGPVSSVTVIDVQRRAPLAEIALPGALGFAQGDGNGRIYVTVQDSNQIIRLDAQSIGNALHRIIDADAKAEQRAANSTREPEQPVNRRPDKPLLLDWTAAARTPPPAEALPRAMSLDSTCQQPRALAIDPTHARLFAACNNFRMVVLDPRTGQTLAALPIGPAPDAIGYDPNRGLIFTANGGGDGSLTIIRQDVTDTYSVIQTLPTRQHARTLAIDPSSGDVYLTSVIYGAQNTTPMTNGRPAAMKVSPVDSSFQVLVVGN